MNRSHSLISRLALLFALVSFTVLAVAGYGLYRALVMQLVTRDDAALVSRADSLRTLLRDMDIVELIHQKPGLFANMLGNREALLVLKFPGQAPLIDVNPGNVAIPDIAPVAAGATLDLSSVHHSMVDGTPFILLTAIARTTDAQHVTHDMHIITGRLLTERTAMLAAYRNEVLAVALAAALLTALLAYWTARRGLRPLRRLADQTGAIGIHNLSTRINGEQAPSELLTLINGFNAMLDRLQNSFAQLSQVSADMAHDLRTPIGNLLGQTEVALSQKRSAGYYEQMLGSNFEELQRLSKMTENMLFLARAEHADHDIDRRSLNVADELKRLADYFEGLAEERDIAIAWQGDGTICADADLLRRALANLLSNAVRYADAGTTITLQSRKESGGTAVSVDNAGPDIEAHHLARLFDRFYRADASRRGSSDASGLGLSIVRGIMLLHQGRWKAESHGGITRFTVFFPDAAPGGP